MPQFMRPWRFAANAVAWRRVLAMQKVVGSSPIIRFSESPGNRGFSFTRPP
jgi:hypothetical protein